MLAATMRGRRVYWVITAALAVAATLALVWGTDDWKRTVREPSADAAYYYAYLPSLVLDGDLDFANQYQVTKNWYRFGPTPLGRAGNVFGIGPAVFALPAFVVGHGVALLSGARTDGFSAWETTLVLWTSIAFTLGAMLVAWRLARRWVGSELAAYGGALIAMIAGPAMYYAFRQPGYAHPAALLFATLLIERWDATFIGGVPVPFRPAEPSDSPHRASHGHAPRALKTWIVLGALAGAAALARPQLALWGLLLPVAMIDDVRRRGATPSMRLVGRWAAALAAAMIVFAPQLVAWKALYGAWYVVPQGPGFMRWDAPAWSETLFSSRNGLLPWAPLYAPMLIGVVMLARRGLRLPLALLLGLFGQALANGAAWDWWAGGSFGGRRFDSCYAVFAVGAAVLLAAGLRALAGPSRLARVVAGAAVAAGLVVALATAELAIRTSVNSARIGGGEAAATVWQRRLGARGWLAARLSALANLPARAVFAWRYGVGLDAYDRRVGAHVLGETYPGLNSYPDKRRDTIAAPGVMVAPHLQLLVGVNRRGAVALRVPIALSAPARVAVGWNGDFVERELAGSGVIELAGEPRRGVNALEIRAPVGAVIAAIEITVP